jgi:two-component system response regulator AlgR
LLEELSEVTVAVVGEAANGAEALKACADLDPDVVLLDIRMPGMDGIEVAALTALMSHRGDLHDGPRRARARGVRDTGRGYLLKPVRLGSRAMRHAARIAAPQLRRLAEQSRSGGGGQVCARLGE